MKTLRARVENGRLRLDEPTGLPEGTELDLALADVRDELGPEERKALHAALRRGWKSATEGRTLRASELMTKLRRRR